MSAWNFIGITAWLIVLAWLIFIIINIRQRHLRMIIKERQRFSAKHLILDIVEIFVFFILFIGMMYVTFFRTPNLKATDEVKLTYSYKPLVLQTNGSQGYFVKVQNGGTKRSTQYYTYWVKGARYEVSSNYATITSTSKPLTVNNTGIPWPKVQLNRIDEQMQQAFVARAKGTYQPNFMNGLGLHVGHTAVDYFLIRVPADTFIETEAQNND
ncbi:hypothetical protein FHQ08_08760 [Lactobacillus sp. CC-MHH1034]|uniref:LVIS_2131 family protein n=1 Tax=Agrilactobacillus fermenti TaxID=2586909 RepID=UPI001E5D5ED1|nr:LVIS_2131 family protein [Agrilactobacillus fermenti]MCD2256813.1 hypothetical protein [Agrilactobacillus fermenti]